MCKWCGSTFRPEDRDQVCCDESCYCAWAGLPSPDDIEEFDEWDNDDGFWDADNEDIDIEDDRDISPAEIERLERQSEGRACGWGRE